MDERIKFFVGLYAHKDSTSVAACEAGREAVVIDTGFTRADALRVAANVLDSG